MKIYIQALIVAAGVCFVQTTFAQDPVKQSPDKYKVVLNNDKVRVLDVRLKPGDKSPMHSHPNNVIYVINGGKAKFTDANGKAMDMTLKTGDCKWRQAEKHAVENTGKTEVHVLNIELKH